MQYLAHSENTTGQVQYLQDHLVATAGLAREHEAKWGAGRWGYLAGLLDDLGKTSEVFRSYVRGRRESGGDHSTVAAENLEPLAFPIIGHHGGLPDKAALQALLAKPTDDASAPGVLLPHV